METLADELQHCFHAALVVETNTRAVVVITNAQKPKQTRATSDKICLEDKIALACLLEDIVKQLSHLLCCKRCKRHPHTKMSELAHTTFRALHSPTITHEMSDLSPKRTKLEQCSHGVRRQTQHSRSRTDISRSSFAARKTCSCPQRPQKTERT